nr:hypothetical protein [Actinopolyspora xinjiangensis]
MPVRATVLVFLSVAVLIEQQQQIALGDTGLAQLQAADLRGRSVEDACGIRLFEARLLTDVA